VFLGQIASEVLVQRMGIYSYWSAIPVPEETIRRLVTETRGLQSRWTDTAMLLLREPQPETGLVGGAKGKQKQQ